MYESNRRTLRWASLGRLLSLGLAGATALVLAQACNTEPPDDGDGGGGSGGTDGGTGGEVSSGGTGGGSGGDPDPMTGGSGGNETGGESGGGSAGEGGWGGQGGAANLAFASESGLSVVYSLPSSVLGGALFIDRAISCQELADASDENAFWGDSRSLLLTYGDKDRTELEPGSYPVTNQPAPDDGKYGSATLVTYDSECTQETAAAPSGVITITAVDGDEITGSYDLDFPGGSLEGTFATDACPGPHWTSSTVPTTCY